MNTVKLTDKINSNKTVVAVGNFDGVHKGHAALIKKAVSLAEEYNCTPAVWTFTDYAPKKDAKHIIQPRERYEIFKELGLKLVFENDFSDVRDFSAGEFVKNVLIEKCGAVYAVCGFNFRFGKGASGDAAALKSLMEKNGAKAEIINEIQINGITVSSTAVRAALCRGDVELAAELTGRPFSVTLPVIHGRRIGTGLGFPTINQAYPDNLTELRRGVYVCRVEADGKTYRAVTNVGVKPTVKSDGVSIETHIIGYDGDLYGRDITVTFLRFLRDERKFSSLEELKKQIEKDKKRAEEEQI